MDSALFLKYQLGTSLVTKCVQRVNPCYEVASLFCRELNKTAGQEYTKKDGTKAIADTYEITRVQSELKKIELTVVKVVDGKKKIVLCEHKCTGFLAECQKSSIGFNRFYGWKLKEARKKKI